ncbi:MAG: hypothetical protein COA79_01455 [Planctomycetota bacterium]|nr:MAG: hypothetical protein COA79_01455 [Planctomycetota bacterium]
MNILIVDDDINITDILGSHLSKHHNITIFNESIVAWDHYMDYHDYDVVLTDYYMPMLFADGFIKRMLSINPTQQIIVISSVISTERRNMLLQYMPLVQIIDKPFTLGEIDVGIKNISNYS